MLRETRDKVSTIAPRFGFYDGPHWAFTLRRRGLGSTEVPMRLIGLAIVLAVILTLAPVVAEGQQQAEKVYRVGWILSSSSIGTAGPLATAFRLGLRERGYVEGQNLIFETRYDEGQPQRLPELVAELVRLRVDTIFAIGDQMIKAAKDATTTIPIVMVACDAVAAGFISSLARPGGTTARNMPRAMGPMRDSTGTSPGTSMTAL